jgi:hypothetical protein
MYGSVENVLLFQGGSMRWHQLSVTVDKLCAKRHCASKAGMCKVVAHNFSCIEQKQVKPYCRFDLCTYVVNGALLTPALMFDGT